MNFELLSSDKNNFKFNEITSMSGVKPYVLRFWESEFDQICPRITDDGQKTYSRQDLDYINRIKVLLFEEKLSIPEAKKRLDSETQIHTEVLVDEETLIVEQPNGVATHKSSLDLMRNALELDFSRHKEVISQKQFNDEDVLNLVQAKKKLSSVLTKINGIVKEKNW